MSLKLERTIPVPLRVDEDGAIRVGQTRVLLDVVVYDFNEGKSPEAIVASYPTLTLADVYGVTFYYLAHRQEIDVYLRERQVQAEDLQREIELSSHPQEFRDRLLARWSEKQRS